MAKSLTGTKTEKNLWEAFAGESQARNKYDYYAAKAKKEGYVQLQEVFEETAHNEKEHAKIWFKLLNGGAVKSTVDNLKDCIAGEKYENQEMYVRMAKEAREEGFDEIANLFEAVGAIELRHQKRYELMLKNVQAKTVFKKETEEVWICINCGNVFRGKIPPEECPVCSHPQGYYKLYCEKF